jgi:tetratricopeptide (TPR) repeat protein
MSDFRFKAFISYSHKDEKTAKWLHRWLENYRLPKQFVTSQRLGSNRVGVIFRDRDELGTSGNLSASIQEALRESECLIIICTPNAARSSWVNEEIKLFKRIRSPDRVFCLLAGDPENSFPEAVLVDVDGDGIATARETEHLAADIRSEGDGKSLAPLKLIAGLLGVRFDVLRQRELHRRQRRLVSITTVSLIGMAAAIFLATFAFLAQQEAEHQRQLAEAEARTAQQVTDFLVDLFEASDPFAELQSDFTVRELLDRGAEKIENSLSSEPRLQARLLATIGQVHTQLGLYDTALRLLDEAYAAQEPILDARDPQLLRTQTSRAWLAIETGNYEHAQSIYDTILPALEEDQLYSDVLEHTEEWCTVINDLGVLQWSNGELKNAKWTLLQALTMEEELYGVDSIEIAATLNNLGLVFAYSGEYEAARPFYERALSIREGVYGPDHPAHMSVLSNLASTVRSLGDFDAAQALLERALRIAEVSLEPDHPHFGSLYNGLGIVLWKQGNYEAALARLEYAGNLFVTASGETGPGVGANLQHQARVFHSKGDLERSKQLYEQSAEALGGHGAGTASELAVVLEKLGEISSASEYYKLGLELATEYFDATNPRVIKRKREYEEFLVRHNLEQH